MSTGRTGQGLRASAMPDKRRSLRAARGWQFPGIAWKTKDRLGKCSEERFRLKRRERRPEDSKRAEQHANGPLVRIS
jgi:hypothetical protein